MRAGQYYAVILTGDVAGHRGLSRKHFRLRAVFDSGWHVHLQSAEDERIDLARAGLSRFRRQPRRAASPHTPLLVLVTINNVEDCDNRVLSITL
jgi:hypothetical protein